MDLYTELQLLAATFASEAAEWRKDWMETRDHLRAEGTYVEGQAHAYPWIAESMAAEYKAEVMVDRIVSALDAIR